MSREYNPDGLNRLMTAVLERAVLDWVYLCEKAHNAGGGYEDEYRLSHGETTTSLKNMDKFFASGWCDMLCRDMNGDVLRNHMHDIRANITSRPRKKKGPHLGGRSQKIYQYRGKGYTLRELSKMSGIPLKTLQGRIYTLRQNIEEAVEGKYTPHTQKAKCGEQGKG